MGRSTLALRTLGAAFLLGLGVDLLLRDRAWGLGFTVFALLTFLTVKVLSAGSSRNRSVDILWAPILTFAVMVAWRDAYELRVVNLVAILVVTGIMMYRASEGSVWQGTSLEYTFGLVGRWLTVVADAALLLSKDVEWAHALPAATSKKMVAVARGLLLAVPTVLLFGVLFSRADAIFESSLHRLFAWDGETVAEHVLWCLLGGLVMAGILRAVLLPQRRPITPGPHAEPSESQGHALTTEIGIVLGSLNALFAGFVGIQFAYLFGGQSVVGATNGLTYADYARGGFFELVTVAALTIPLLLGCHSLLSKDDAHAHKVFIWTAGPLIALLLVVMISAFKRMGLYVDMYGLTVLRLYTSAFMIWLGATATIFLVTVLARRTERFAAYSATAGLGAALALNVINPDGLIARVNLAMPEQMLDVEYLRSLSADAVPVLMESSISTKAVRELRTEVVDPLPESDWRSWSFSRLAAHNAIVNFAGKSLKQPNQN